MRKKTARAKTKSTIKVPDGAGGMVAVEDRRFEKRDWPISFTVTSEQAEAAQGRAKRRCAGSRMVMY